MVGEDVVAIMLGTMGPLVIGLVVGFDDEAVTVLVEVQKVRPV